MIRGWTFYIFLAAVLIASNSQAQNRFYHVYLDNDSDQSTGCLVNLPDFSTAIQGADSRVTVTTDSALPPTITSTQLATCDGTVFNTPSSISAAALGLNTGLNSNDVFEIAIPPSAISNNTKDRATLYFVTDSDAVSDIVLTGTNGGPITLGFPQPIPTLGLLAMGILLLLLLLVSRKQLSRKLSTSVVLIALCGIAWAAVIIIDGQTNDWSGINPAASDPINDTSGTGSYADLTAVFATQQNDSFYVRLDVVDVENQAPVANPSSAATTEDTAVTITVSGTDAEGSAITFLVDTPPSNGTLSGFTVINATTSTVQYTPDANHNGSDSFTIRANDGQITSAPALVNINISAVNDAPFFTSGGNVNQLKTAGVYSEPWATSISPGATNESTQNLTFTVLSNDNAAIFSTQPNIDSAGTLSFEGVLDATGTANLTVNLTDDGGTANGGDDTSTTVGFSITLQGVNDAPSFVVGADQVVNEDVSAVTITAWATAISAGPADESGQGLTFTVINNNNPALFSVAPQVNATSGDLTFTPAADANGAANLSVFLMDDGGTANGGQDTSPTATFNITVTAVNDAPSFTAGPNESVLEGAGAQTVNGWATAISPGPVDEATQSTSFNVSNNNNALFSVQPAIDNAGNLSYSTNPSALGTATVSVSISDDGGTANGGVDTSAIQTFDISVTMVNDEPSFTVGANQTANEDAGTVTIPNWATNILAGPPDEAGQNLTFNITANDNAAMFSAGPAVDASGTLSYTPAADANGVANISLELMDDGGTANGGDDTSPPQSFSITVDAVNDAPTFTAGANQSVLEESGAQTVNGWATAISPGPTDEAAQTVGFTVTNNNNALFSIQPAVDAAGNLTYTPTLNTSGVATVNVTAVDSGGTANGGVDTSAGQNFTITIIPVNDAPSFTAATNPVATDEDGGAESLTWAAAISAGPADESGQTLTFNLTQTNIDATLSFAVAPTVNSSTGNVEYTAASNTFGSATYDVVLMDDGGTANGGVDTSSPVVSLTITVNPVNDAPTVTAPGPFPVTTNIRIVIPDGANDLLAGASDIETGTTLTVQGTGIITTTQGGTVTVDNSTGTFTYDPAPGFTGTDSFNYQVCDDGVPLPSACSAAATVTLNVAGNTVWFIDNTATAGNGTLQTPFNSLTAFNTSTDPGTGDYVFIATGTGSYNEAGINLSNNQILFGQGTAGDFDTITGLTAAPLSINRPMLNGSNPVITSTSQGIVLAQNNTLRGIDISNTVQYGLVGTNVGNLTVDNVAVTGNGGAIEVSGSGSFGNNVNFNQLDSNSSAISGINLVNVTGTMSVSLAGTGLTNNSASPAMLISGGNLNLAYPGNITNSVGRSLDIFNKTSGTINLTGNIVDSGSGINLSNNTGATLNLASINLTTTNNNAITAINGGVLNITGNNNSIVTTTGRIITMDQTTIGSSGITLRSINNSAGDFGITIVNGGTSGSFTVTGTGTIAGSAGIIQNTSDNGLFFQNTNNINISNLNVNNGTNEVAGCLAGVSGLIGNCNGAIEFNNVSNINLVNMTIDGDGDASDELGIFAQNVSNFDMNGVTIQNVSDAQDEHGIYVVNLAGTGSDASRWQDLTVNNTVGDTAILITQNSGNAELTIDGDSTISNAREGGFEARTTNAAANLTVTLGDASAVGVGETVLFENTGTGASFIADNGAISANVRNTVFQPGAGVASIIRAGSGANGVMFVGMSAQSGGASSLSILNASGNDITEEDGGAGGTGRAGMALGGSRNINGNIIDNLVESNDEYVRGFFTNFIGVGNLATNTISIDNNIINMTGSGGNETIVGIEYVASDSNGELSVTTTNNTVFSAGDNGFSGGIFALVGDSGGGDNNTLCTDIIGNNATAPNAIAVDGEDYGFVSFAGTVFQLENPIIGALTEPQVDNHIINNDSGTSLATDVNVFNVGGSFTGVNSSCPQ